MGKYIYRFYWGANYAITWRDPDDIHIEDIAYFTTIKKAEKFIIDYLRKELNYVVDNIDFFAGDYRLKKHKETEEQLPKKIKLDKNGQWYFTNGGSWARTYILERKEVE